MSEKKAKGKKERERKDVLVCTWPCRDSGVAGYAAVSY